MEWLVIHELKSKHITKRINGLASVGWTLQGAVYVVATERKFHFVATLYREKLNA